MLLYKKLRDLQYFVIFMQVLADLIGCGIGGLFLYTVELSLDYKWVLEYKWAPDKDVSN